MLQTNSVVPEMIWTQRFRIGSDKQYVGQGVSKIQSSRIFINPPARNEQQNSPLLKM